LIKQAKNGIVDDVYSEELHAELEKRGVLGWKTIYPEDGTTVYIMKGKGLEIHLVK